MKIFFPFFLVLTIAQNGCSSSGSCHCPSGITYISLPPGLNSAVTRVSGDSCSSAGDPQNGMVPLTASRASSCHVRVDLANGKTLVTTVTFASVGGCCAFEYVGTQSATFEFVDGGSPD